MRTNTVQSNMEPDARSNPRRHWVIIAAATAVALGYYFISDRSASSPIPPAAERSAADLPQLDPLPRAIPAEPSPVEAVERDAQMMADQAIRDAEKLGNTPPIPGSMDIPDPETAQANAPKN